MEETSGQPSVLINSHQGFDRISHIPRELLITSLFLRVQSKPLFTRKRNCGLCLLENHSFSNAIFLFKNIHVVKLLTTFNYLPKVTRIKETLHTNCIKVFWIRAQVRVGSPWPKQWRRLEASQVEFLLKINNNFRSKTIKQSQKSFFWAKTHRFPPRASKA